VLPKEVIFGPSWNQVCSHIVIGKSVGTRAIGVEVELQYKIFSVCFVPSLVVVHDRIVIVGKSVGFSSSSRNAIAKISAL
jgi:hypothetical protein